MNFIKRTNQVAEPQPKKAKRNRSPWWTSFAAFIDGPMADLTPTAIKVWLYLFRRSSKWKAAETEQQIAVACGITDRAVRKGIRLLVDRQLLTIESIGNRNKGPSRYRILPPSTGTRVPPEHDCSSGTHVPPGGGSQPEHRFHLNGVSGGTPVPTATGTPVPTPHDKQCDAPPLASAVAMNRGNE